MGGKKNRSQSEDRVEASRRSRQSDATPVPLGEDLSSAGLDSNPVLPEPAIDAELDVNPWEEVMKDFARLVLAAYKADPHRFD